MKADSGIALNLRIAIQQVGENLIQNASVRELLNQRISGIAVNLSDQYSEKVIRFISERIHEWDSREMIAKIENEVGGDYKYYLKDSYDENEEFMYYSKDDYDNYRKGKADEECKQYFDRHKKDLKKRISDGGCLDDGNVDAKYD